MAPILQIGFRAVGSEMRLGACKEQRLRLAAD